MKTAKLVFEGLLTELSKVKAPSLTLSEFNYYINKAILLYVNKRYNIYDINLLTTDDVRVLKSTAYLTPICLDEINNLLLKLVPDSESYLAHANLTNYGLYKATYEVDLPGDYLHLLNCICTYKVNKNYKCYDANSYVQFAAKRLTADSWSEIINDYYNRPTPERPYFYLHNINTLMDVPTNPVLTDDFGKYSSGTDMNGIYGVTSNREEIDGEIAVGGESGYKAYSTEKDLSFAESLSNFPRVLTLSSANITISNVEKPTAHRPLNPSKVRCEIRYGKDRSIFELVQVLVDYIKVPQYIRLTQDLMDLTEDFSQIMEFPDNVCGEIINELTNLVMERDGDPRLQSHVAVTLSVALPAQQQAAPALS